ncbi:MAG: T9SS type A sorting domain-containing protein [Bacteroidia bacterium]|nr:T9SS type A sorting domain-containing protein [Bacteroidia bacterium]
MKNFAFKPQKIFLLSFISFFLFTAAIIGFDESHNGRLIHDGERLGKVGDCPAPTIEKLRMKFGINQAAAKAKLLNIQKNVVKAIEFIRHSDPSVADCLKNAQENNRLCIEFAAARSIIGVTKTAEPGCNADRVNINWPYMRGCDSISTLDSGFIFLVNVLLHEGIHMEQTTTPNDFTPTDTRTDSSVRRWKKSFDMELGAIDSTQKLWCPLIDSLSKSIAGGGTPIPNPLPGGAVGNMLGELNRLPNNAKRLAKAREIIQQARLVKILNARYRERNAKGKKFACDFLADSITSVQLVDSFRRLGVLRLQNPFEGNVESIIYPDPNGFAVTQTNGEVFNMLFHDLEFISDIFLPNPDQMIIAGPNGFGQTILVGYGDTDGDGLFDNSSAQMLLTLNNSDLGLDFIPFPDGRLLIFDYQQQQMLELVDGNRDGFPDQVLPQPLSQPIPEPVVDWVASPSDPRLLIGLPFKQGIFQTINPRENYFLLEDQNSDNFYDFIFEEDRNLNIGTAPLYMLPPQPGNLEDSIHGSAFSMVEVLEVDSLGDSVRVIGMMGLDEFGFGVVNYGLPLPPGIRLQLRDRDRLKNSPIYLLDNTNSISDKQSISLNIYPNPARDFVNLDFESRRNEKISVILYDLQGRKVREWELGFQTGDQKHRLPIQGIPRGNYLLLLQNEETKLARKLRIEQ